MRTKRRIQWMWTLACAVGAAACDTGMQPEPNLRFGQSGQLVVDVVTPQRVRLLSSSPDGELRQTLTWRSNGEWQLFESISYRGRIGSETITRSPGAPVAFASAYARTVVEFNGVDGLELFIDALDPTLDPVCVYPKARVTLRVQDEVRDQETSWTRCARKGPLGSLDPAGSGPDLPASRVIQVSKFIHDRTLGDTATSAYHRSVPFATLYKGGKPGDLQLSPRVFFGGPGAEDEPADWRDFWGWLAGTRSPPAVDWSTDMVLVAGDGARYEAGNTIEVRQIEPIRDGAIVRLVEFVPGDFCSPAAVVQTPYHLVVAPRTLTRIQFSDFLLEVRVPCGL